MATSKEKAAKPSAFEASLDNYFGLTRLRTNVRTEAIAGLTTFLTMAYIIFVNPAILANAGMDKNAVFVATCLAAAVCTLVMGLYANYPIALAPGMGLNAFFAFTIVLTYKYTWQQALAAVFLSGVLFLLVSVFKIREYIINAIPYNHEARDLGGRRPVPRHHRARAGQASWSIIRRRWSRSAASRTRSRCSCLFGFVLIAALNHRKILGGTLIGILVVDADRNSVRSGAVCRYRLDAAVDRADLPQVRLLAHLRAFLHHRGAHALAGRSVRQRRHADRRHPPRRGSWTARAGSRACARR